MRQLARELGSRGASRAALESALTRLTARGDLIELRGGHFVAASQSREFAVGRLHLHRDGYGFLIPDKPMPGIAGDVLIRAGAEGGAMHGDRVLAKVGDSRGKGEPKARSSRS